MRKALFCSLLSLSVVVVGSACSRTGATCQASSECGEGGACLPIGSCAVACTASNNACVPGEKCSQGGGCVPADRCGADPDCASGDFCQAGACGKPCNATSNACGAGYTCEADGHCRPTPVTGGTGGGSASSCGGELFQSSHVQANFLIVLDQSGSMMEDITGGTKWSVASQSLKQVTTRYQSQIRFGLSMFSAPMNCNAGRNFVPVGDNTATAIAAALPMTATGNGTPIGGALRLAQNEMSIKDTSRANFVMLVTDGKENCQGRPVDEVKALATAGIKTFVVGFGADVDATMLANMAVAGGTARNTTPRYYQADDPATLNAAFASIAQGAIGCEFRLARPPPDPSKIFVYVNGQSIPRDTAKQVGWDYTTPANDRLSLYGTVCDAVANSPGTPVQIIYGCPDPTLIEGGGDGGYIGGLDGGITIN
ncbi:MAG: VWA domain-containing protein [Myxococcaceae bacterium]|nr:VWA domain-containing protein [Myxococcaceae bacterium]